MVFGDPPGVSTITYRICLQPLATQYIPTLNRILFTYSTHRYQEGILWVHYIVSRLTGTVCLVLLFYCFVIADWLPFYLTEVGRSYNALQINKKKSTYKTTCTVFVIDKEMEK